jgi:hypothetical protein
MISSSYLRPKAAAPPGLKQFFDQRIMPAAIDGAACLDLGIAGAGRQLRRNPGAGLGLMLGMGVFLAVAFRARRAR